MYFSQISTMLVVAAILGVIARRFKQPVLIGYIFAGLLLSFFGLLKDRQLLESMGKIGVALLLFLIGLEMNIRELPTIGKVALLTGIGQITFTFIIGFLLAIFLGFSPTPAAYIAIAVSFSSTIIIVKLLSEKKDLASLYGKVAVGFLLVQDLVAILILLFLSGIGQGGVTLLSILLMIIKAVAVFGSVWMLSRKALPLLFEKYVAPSQELLFIVSIAWALGIASLVAGPLGFTLEIGGFLAGISLSNLPEHLEIASRTRPLRDFFLTIFFLGLGANLLLAGLNEIFIPALIFSALVLVGKPIIVMIVMGFLRFKKRTSFLTSVAVAQISEFSLIIMAMGLSLGYINQSHVALIVMVAAITMTVSTYLILGSEKVYEKVKGKLAIFERKNPEEVVLLEEKDFNDHIVLVGCDRTGRSLLPYLKKKKYPYLIVDFNPRIYQRLSAEKHPVIFGDIGDPEILEAVNIDSARMIISTTSNLSDNLIILEYLRALKQKPISIITALIKNDAIKLYEKGANYVVIPDVVAGEYLRHLFRTYGTNYERFAKIGKSHFNRLIKR